MFGVLGRLFGDSNGNMAVILAFMLVPLLFMTGMSSDYALASMRQNELNAVADAAALAAVRPSILSENDAASTTAATNAFNAQASTITGINYSSSNLAITVTDTTGLGVVKRTVTVSYSAQSKNAFLNIMWGPTIALSGTAQAIATNAPNIDFYLLLDDSPSMAIAATSGGITTMVNNTTSQGGCAFACHESQPAQDNLGNAPITGYPNGGEDNYALARALGVTLRIDNLQTAVQNLMTTAQSTETTDGAQYRMAIYSFDSSYNLIQTLTSSLTTASNSATNIKVVEIPYNNYNSDEYTDYDNGMTNINTTMPTPGLGTNSVNDSPQEVLFFVTDGVEDENVSGNRQESLMDNGWCTTIKDRGIRIAVLYTEYLPLPTNSWYMSKISPFQPNIGPTLQNCASPGLYYEVTTDGDISAALTALFQTAVTTAHLSR